MRDSPLIHIRQIHRLTNEIHQSTKEIHQVSKDRTLQMIIDSINTSERYNECTVSPFGLPLAALRVMPSAPSGTTCRSLTLADKPWLLRPSGALAALRDSLQLTFGKSLVCPSGSECHTVTRQQAILFEDSSLALALTAFANKPFFKS